MSVAWHPVSKVHRQDVAPDHLLITLDVPADVTASHVQAGQYVHVHTPHGEGTFALASSPGAPMELLVKNVGPAALALHDASPVQQFMVSPAQGGGFVWGDVTADDRVLLVATGTGIAPLRPLFHALLKAGIQPQVFYGAPRASQLAFAGELRSHATFYVSQEPAPDRMETGRVTQGLAQLPHSTRRTVAFLAGVSGMVQDATALLKGQGVAPQDIRLNF